MLLFSEGIDSNIIIIIIIYLLMRPPHGWSHHKEAPFLRHTNIVAKQKLIYHSTKISTSKWVECQRKWSQPSVGFIARLEYANTLHYYMTPKYRFSCSVRVFFRSHSIRPKHVELLPRHIIIVHLLRHVYAHTHTPFHVWCEESVHVCVCVWLLQHISVSVTHKSKWWCTHRRRERDSKTV